MMLADYDTIHDAISLLWSIIEQVEGDLHRRVLSAITYLREQAYESLPWPGDVLPNKGWNGKRV